MSVVRGETLIVETTHETADRFSILIKRGRGENRHDRKQSEIDMFLLLKRRRWEARQRSYLEINILGRKPNNVPRCDVTWHCIPNQVRK
jgi:hypothetical protein